MSAPPRPWRSLEPDLFQFATTALHELHAALMLAFDQAAVLRPALNVDQVREELARVGWDEPLDGERLQQALGSLVGWGLLEATQDHSAQYGTPEEFERRNLQWSSTRKGEAAVAGALRALEVLSASVGLQSAVLDAIGDALGDLDALLGKPEPDAARVHIRLRELEGHLQALVESARRFNAHLQRLVRDDAGDEAVFVDVKRATIGYLQDYVDGVERPMHRVATRIGALERRGTTALFDTALAGANLAPVASGDPGPAWIAERVHRWDALGLWFAPADGAAPRIRDLLDVARTAIIELLRAMERRNDSRRRSTSLAGDFRRLADAFEACPGDAEAHRLFAAAFGLWPARHAHKPPADGTARAPHRSWLDAEPVSVEPALRTSGSLAERGRDPRVGDPAELRAARARRAAEALAARGAVQARLHTSGPGGGPGGGPERLSALAARVGFDEAAFDELLRLAGSALNAPRGTDGRHRALSADGRVEIVIGPELAGGSATFETARGTFSAPELEIALVVDGHAADGNAVDDRAAAGPARAAAHG